jgi:glutathione S-transferase
MSLDFYYAPMSSATPIHWALEELGVPYEKVKIDLEAGEQKKPEYLSINPNGKVPAIMHDGVAIWESAAIMIYLGETFGTDKGLFPALGPARGEAMKWIVWANATLGEAASRHRRNSSDKISVELRNPRAAAQAKDDLATLVAMLDKTLTGQDYLVENKFSLTDVHVASFVAYIGMSGIEMTGYKAVMQWKDRCIGRPAYVRAMAG